MAKALGLPATASWPEVHAAARSREAAVREARPARSLARALASLPVGKGARRGR